MISMKLSFLSWLTKYYERGFVIFRSLNSHRLGQYKLILCSFFTISLLGIPNPFSNLASVVASICKILASFFMLRPFLRRYLLIYSPNVVTVLSNGSCPRNSIILGMNLSVGSTRFFAQFVIVLDVTPICR